MRYGSPAGAGSHLGRHLRDVGAEQTEIALRRVPTELTFRFSASDDELAVADISTIWAHKVVDIVADVRITLPGAQELLDRASRDIPSEDV